MNLYDYFLSPHQIHFRNISRYLINGSNLTLCHFLDFYISSLSDLDLFLITFLSNSLNLLSSAAETKFRYHIKQEPNKGFMYFTFRFIRNKMRQSGIMDKVLAHISEFYFLFCVKIIIFKIFSSTLQLLSHI